MFANLAHAPAGSVYVYLNVKRCPVDFGCPNSQGQRLRGAAVFRYTFECKSSANRPLYSCTKYDRYFASTPNLFLSLSRFVDPTSLLLEESQHLRQLCTALTFATSRAKTCTEQIARKSYNIVVILLPNTTERHALCRHIPLENKIYTCSRFLLTD